MLHILPEELLLKILGQALLLPADTFSGHEYTNFGAGTFDLSRAHLTSSYPLASTSSLSSVRAVLGVCRTWARIGTPLAYDAVMLRSPGQCHKFALALQSSLKSPLESPIGVQRGLGRFVRRLRVEAGCEAFLEAITCHTPNVHTLALSLDFPLEYGFHGCPYPSVGVLRALACVSPRRLMLKREHCVRGCRVDDMMWLVSRAVEIWFNLVRPPLFSERIGG